MPAYFPNFTQAYQVGDQKRQQGSFGHHLAGIIGGAIVGFVGSGFNPLGAAAGAASAIVGDVMGTSDPKVLGTVSNAIMTLGSRKGSGSMDASGAGAAGDSTSVNYVPDWKRIQDRYGIGSNTPQADGGS